MNNTLPNQTFIKEYFSLSGGYLTYYNGEKYIFIARFKYSTAPVSPSHFKTALKNNFTPTEWVELMEKHQQNPTKVIETKLPNWKKKIVDKWVAREEAKIAKRRGTLLSH